MAGGSTAVDTAAQIVSRLTPEAVRVELEYEKPMIGGCVATGYDPALEKDGTILENGYIAPQAESQPVEFRNVRLLNLSGCMDPASPSYRACYAHRDDSRCAR